MSDNTNIYENINFADFMSSKGSDDLDNFFDTLSDAGISVATTSEEFLSDEDACYTMYNLSDNLVFYGKWMAAKVAGFTALKETGFEAIKASSDRSETIEVKHSSGNEVFVGEWCRKEGVVYASFNGVIEVASASEAKTKLQRDKADLKTAKFLLSALYQDAANLRNAA